jgi:hypothetical protein
MRSDAEASRSWDDGNASGRRHARRQEGAHGRRSAELAIEQLTTHLADALKHVNRWPEVADVEYWQRELDEAIVSHTVRVIFMTRRAGAALLVRPLLSAGAEKV